MVGHSWVKAHRVTLLEHAATLGRACSDGSRQSTFACAASLSLHSVIGCADGQTSSECIQHQARLLHEEVPSLLALATSGESVQQVVVAVRSLDVRRRIEQTLATSGVPDELRSAIGQLRSCADHWCEERGNCPPLQIPDRLRMTLACLGNCSELVLAINLLSIRPGHRATCMSMLSVDAAEEERNQRARAAAVVAAQGIDCVFASCSAEQVRVAAAAYHAEVGEVRELCMPRGGGACSADALRRADAPAHAVELFSRPEAASSSTGAREPALLELKAVASSTTTTLDAATRQPVQSVSSLLAQSTPLLAAGDTALRLALAQGTVNRRLALASTANAVPSQTVTTPSHGGSAASADRPDWRWLWPGELAARVAARAGGGGGGAAVG